MMFVPGAVLFLVAVLSNELVINGFEVPKE